MKKFGNLHICTGANYVTVNGYIKLINENFPNAFEEHWFLVCDKISNPLQKVSQYKNVEFIEDATGKNFKKIIGYMKNSHHVYFHSMGWLWQQQAKLLMHPGIMKKSTWVEWGADLFDWKRDSGSKIKDFIANKILATWRSRVSSVVCIYPADEKIYRQSFGNRAKVFHAIYSLFYHEDMLRCKPENPIKSDTLQILVGHSAVKNCHHFECFDALSKFKDENIMLHIPLTYGDMEYKEQVKSRALEIFPAEKLNFIEQNMELDDYTRFLWGIDIGVFCVFRQIALGNICKLLYSCKKVYLPKGSLMYDCFTEQKTEVFDFYEIANESFEEFSAPPKSTEPSEYMKGRMTKENVLKQWEEVFKEGL